MIDISGGIAAGSRDITPPDRNGLDLDGRQNTLDGLHLIAREDETHRVRHIWVIARGPALKNAGTDLGLAAIPGIITASVPHRANQCRIGSR
jgi:hypothetical protein